MKTALLDLFHRERKSQKKRVRILKRKPKRLYCVRDMNEVLLGHCSLSMRYKYYSRMTHQLKGRAQVHVTRTKRMEYYCDFDTYMHELFPSQLKPKYQNPMIQDLYRLLRPPSDLHLSMSPSLTLSRLDAWMGQRMEKQGKGYLLSHVLSFLTEYRHARVLSTQRGRHLFGWILALEGSERGYTLPASYTSPLSECEAFFRSVVIHERDLEKKIRGSKVQMTVSLSFILTYLVPCLLPTSSFVQKLWEGLQGTVLVTHTEVERQFFASL